MPYTQKWGISRNAFQSPLHNNGEEDNQATNIIEQNNERSNKQAANIASSGSFLTKQIAKQGIRNYISPAIGKVAGVLGMFLTSTSAQAGQLSPEQQREKIRSRGDLSKEEFDRINTNQDGGELPFKNN